MAEPLILTVTLDPACQKRFDQLRARHFPPRVNYLAAHVTIFHHLPGEEVAAIDRHLALACQALQPTPFTVTGLRFLGRGVAYGLDMPAITRLRAALASEWHAWLTPQDRQPWRAHVTIQNKVSATEARQLYEALMTEFQPWAGHASGLRLWSYLGGPWRELAFYGFTPQAA